jgi:hypothetical protein
MDGILDRFLALLSIVKGLVALDSGTLEASRMTGNGLGSVATMRLKSEVWVSAYVRRCFVEGVFAWRAGAAPRRPGRSSSR